ncbi:MAG: CaiB/BaiF CoA transferase family protein [Hyphomicrobiaceae bacterium]
MSDHIVKRPLDGIRVLDLSRVLAGPYAGLMLADLGAEVIKVENPAHGDDSRTFTVPSHNDHAVYFLTVNRNKKSVALDLKAPQGKAAFLKLVANSDVVLENFRTGVMERLGLGYDTLKSVRPDIIVCAISGYGRDGPNVDVPGYDPVAQAESGLMAMTGDPQGPPTRAGISLVDMITGLYASNAISAALRQKQITGEGRFIELSLFETGINMLVNFGHQYLMTGNEPTRAGNGNQVAQPAGVFEASDGPFMVTIGNDVQYARLCNDVVGRPDLVDDPRFVDNKSRVANTVAIREVFGEIFLHKTRAEWVTVLRAGGVPCGVVATVAEALDSELVTARGSVQPVTHSEMGSYPAIMTPARLHDTEAVSLAGAPLLGEHTRDVLRDVAGLDEAEVEALVAARVARVG